MLRPSVVQVCNLGRALDSSKLKQASIGWIVHQHWGAKMQHQLLLSDVASPNTQKIKSVLHHKDSGAMTELQVSFCPQA